MLRSPRVQTLYWVAAAASLLAAALHARAGNGLRAASMVAIAAGLGLLGSESTAQMTPRRVAAYVLIIIALGLLGAQLFRG